MTESLLKHLVADESRITIFISMNLVERTVGQLAVEALSRTVS
jgi:hypothetical protein